MTPEERRAVALAHKTSHATSTYEWSAPLFIRQVNIAVQPKERPRTGRNGHVYTPKKTQDCEKAIAHACDDAPLLLHPVRLQIRLFERAPSTKLAGFRWLRPSKSDVDNKVKTITDALNGVIYRDDRQISAIDASARYTDQESHFWLHVYRDGLSASEWEDVRKTLPHV